MKKILSIILLCGVILASVAGCGKTERLLYNVDLSKHITLGKYKNLTVDTESDDYKAYYDSAKQGDVENNELYAELKSGKVQNGDIANIDYEGKKDSVAFEGGTAKGYDLEIGSGSFIEGFEEGLIGVSIGDTVDLNLKFPENYGNEELNGAAVVFTVKVNSVKRAKEAKDYYKDLGFKSLDDYEKDLKKRAASACLIDMVVEDTKMIKYSDKDIDTLYEYEKKQMDNYYQNNYGMDLKSVISSSGMTEEDFKKQVLENSIYPQAKRQMALYQILDEERLSCTEKDINNHIDTIAKEAGVTADKVKEYYDDFYLEMLYVTEIVSDFIYNNSTVK